MSAVAKVFIFKAVIIPFLKPGQVEKNNLLKKAFPLELKVLPVFKAQGGKPSLAEI